MFIMLNACLLLCRAITIKIIHRVAPHGNFNRMSCQKTAKRYDTRKSFAQAEQSGIFIYKKKYKHLSSPLIFNMLKKPSEYAPFDASDHASKENEIPASHKSQVGSDNEKRIYLFS